MRRTPVMKRAEFRTSSIWNKERRPPLGHALCFWGSMPDRKQFAETTGQLPGEFSARRRVWNPSGNDTLLQRRITDCIRSSAEVDASDVSVVVQNRSATLFGSVKSEAQRALIQGLACSVSGVLDINNRLKVVPSAH